MPRSKRKAPEREHVTMTVEEFHEALKAQGVPREHLAFKCPMCGTIQSMDSLIRAGVEPEKAENYIGFSCEGRWTDAGSPANGKPAPGKRGCNWTLGGLFQTHNLTVVDGDGKGHPRFEVATAEEAKGLMVEMEASNVSV